MNVLIIGGGGREHALAWKLANEEGVATVSCAPGNFGIAAIAGLIPTSADDWSQLAEQVAPVAGARGSVFALTVVGPEVPLDAGICDLFASRGLRIFGPSRAAAQLECSKVFAKAFMARHGIPTARYRACASADAARAIIRSGELGFPVVVKADGLAAGKGVVIAPDAAAAEVAVQAAMDDRQFGEAGARIVLEECLTGPEVSFFALCDGRRAVPLMSAQDHKRIFDDDQGPNTGGMGAFAPSPLVDDAMQVRIMREVVDPVVNGMRAEGHEYRGFLYAGLMLTCDGPKVIEFNVRFGDPEAQVVIPMIAGDLAPHLVAAADGELLDRPLAFSPQKHVGVVLASEGYPSSGPTGRPIMGLDAAAALEGVLVFHSGTRGSADVALGKPLTAGGRVLTVVGRGATYQEATARAYDGVSRISFAGMQFRRDIGRKAVSQ
ncbi:MAG: phosphoribosylamine--glycine ligase [Vicinamibacterales bacterium]